MNRMTPIEKKNDIVRWIQDYFKANGPECSAVVGISGGKDSSIVAALCVEALGKDRVIGVLMPNGEQSDIQDSLDVCEALQINSLYINIAATCRALEMQIEIQTDVSEQTKINMPPRIRMATLYAVAQSLPHGGRVANTCNYSEDFVGYSTKYGDSAGDFSPLARLTVSDVRQIGYELPIPRRLVDKTPSDGLCGRTDEDNLGMTYQQIDAYIVNGTSGDADVDRRICQLHTANLHKLTPMPSYCPIDAYEYDG